MQTIGPDVARRTALAAQGFADPRPSGQITRRHLSRTLSRIRLLQLDSVNVAERAHYLPLFSRLGPYPKGLVDDAAWTHSARRPRLLVEYWAHAASLIPVGDWPLLRWRMREFENREWPRAQQALRRSPTLPDEILDTVKALGPLSAGAIERELGAPSHQRPGQWWNRSDTKMICEWLFATGRLTTGARRSFERLYDLPDRVLPPEVLAAPADVESSTRQLIVKAAAALGVATEPDLRDYYRLPPVRSQHAVAELVADGELERVAVRGWAAPAYRHPGSRAPRRVTGAHLLCPFDPLIWRRERTERLFGFHYRIEIYVPGPQRRYGYYVFPFLLDGELVARVDLKSDRAAGVLRVPGAFAEPGTRTSRVAAELATALREMAGWLELDAVEVGDRGDLAGPLAAAVS